MWQSPNQKNRGPGSKRSGRERYRCTLRVKRVTVEIRSVNDPMIEGKKPEVHGSARILMNDISPHGVGIFCNKPFVAGQEVAMMLTTPTLIFLRGKVTHCLEHDNRAHVITPTPFLYRIGIKFIFENAAEEAAVTKYCEDMLHALYAVED